MWTALSEARKPVTLIGASTGDRNSEFQGLASGDLNGHGISDLIVGSRLANGPEESREEGGEVAVVFGEATLSEPNAFTEWAATNGLVADESTILDFSQGTLPSETTCLDFTDDGALLETGNPILMLTDSQAIFVRR